MTDKVQNGWALVGKILTALAVLIGGTSGAVIVYDWLTKDAHLDARVFAAPYRYPPETPVTASTQHSNSGARPGAGNTEELARADALQRQLDALNRYPGFIEFDIRNSGGAQARDVAIYLPYNGIAEIRAKGSEPRPVKFAASIPVGTIPPTASVTVYAWTSQEPADYYENEFRVTHATGVGSIVFLHESDGFWRTLGRALLGIGELVAFVVAFFGTCLVVVAAVQGLSRLARKRPSPPPPPPNGA